MVNLQSDGLAKNAWTIKLIEERITSSRLHPPAHSPQGFQQPSESVLLEVCRSLENTPFDGRYPFRRATRLGPIGKTRSSTIFKYTPHGDNHAIALKFCIDPHSRQLAPADACRQFTALQQVQVAAMGHPIVRTPRPVLLFEEQACVAMEWIDGLSVAEFLMNRSTSRADIALWSRRAGEWLAAFHQLNSKAFGSADTGLMLTRLDQTIASSSELSDNAVLCGAVGQLRRTASIVRSNLLPVAWRHGDFKAQNLIISNDNSLAALDLDVQDQDVIAADLAKFIDDIELLSWHPSAWRLRRYQHLIIANFLAGYKRDQRLPLLLPLAWLRLYRLAMEWLEFEMAARRSVTQIYQRYCFKRYCRTLNFELERQFDNTVNGRNLGTENIKQ